MPEETARETNKKIARSMLGAWNEQHESHLPDDLISPTLVTYFPHPIGRLTRGRRKRSKSEIVLPRVAFPDQHFEEQILIADDERVFIAWEFTGTNTGRLYGRPATGKPVTAYGADVLRIVDGKIVEHWDYYTKARTHALARLGLFDLKMQEYLMAEGLLGRGRAVGRR